MVDPLDFSSRSPHNRGMAKLTVVFGVLLIVLGVGGFIASGNAAKTALIPAYVGLPLVILGAVATKPNLRMHAMHASVLLAMIGFLMSAIRLAVALSRGEGSALGRFTLGGMAVLTGLFVVLCVRSFIAARKARQASAAP